MKLSSLKYFFTYETKIPDGIGFKLFGIWHILCLLLCLAVTVVSLHWYWKAKAQKKQKFEKTIASRRAMMMLREQGILGEQELGYTRKVLTAAALTYVASAAAAILQLLRIILLFGGRDRD